MIVAEFEYEKHYSEVHDELVEFLKQEFLSIEHGLQGDSWIWITENNDKVAIDTFSSMNHQIKTSNNKSTLAIKIIDRISTKYKLRIYDIPELESHE